MANRLQQPWFRSIFQFSAATFERGLKLADSGLQSAQSVPFFQNQPTNEVTKAPVDGYESIDLATSDFANRLLRFALLRRSDLLNPRNVLNPNDGWFAEWTNATSTSFDRVFPKNFVNWLVFPSQVGLSFGSLFSQEALRGVAAAQAVSPNRWIDFLNFVVEIFSDLDIYFTLQYQEELERLRNDVQRRPTNSGRRIQLARTEMKCGLFAEAVQTLNDLTSAQAAYERMVSRYKLGQFDAAAEDGIQCLNRHWLWLAAEARGGYPNHVRPEHRLAVVDGFAPTSVQLEEVADEIGISKISGGRGVAVFDFDGDGHLDVVIAGAHSGCTLYRNNGDGTFTDVSVGSGLDKIVYAFAISVGDYNNDGLPDLYISSLGFFNGEGRLMRNNGDGTFTDVTREAGLSSWGPGFSACWVDYNQNGLLDLFVANNLGGLFDRKTPNRLFRNNGDGTFTDVTRQAGLLTEWPTIGASWGDIDNNGLPDLFVNSLGRAQLFRNRGDGTFADVSRAAGIDLPAIGSVATWCDFDDDGWLDILQATYSRPLDAIHTLTHGHGPTGSQPMRLFRNNRDGTFTNVGQEAGITGCWGTMSMAVADFNNDGYQDILLGNGDPSMDRTEGPTLLQQNAQRQFSNVSFSAGLPPTGKGHGVVMADLSGDGRMHFVVANGGLYPGDLQATEIYRPTLRPGNFVNIRLVGTRSNRDAIGARIALTASGRTQHRLVSGGSNFGCVPFEQHFGLAETEVVGQVRIRWPSGLEQVIESVPVNATVSLTEGESDWRIVKRS